MFDGIIDFGKSFKKFFLAFFVSGQYNIIIRSAVFVV